MQSVYICNRMAVFTKLSMDKEVSIMEVDSSK